jgi:DNA (cytosine-5)-methyltransferase 1
MTFGSLFAGIGGFDLGFERAGMTCKWQVENHTARQELLGLRFPEAAIYGDVRQFALNPNDSLKVDVICGGFPCQDISYCGKGEGIEGERSGLWSEFARVIRVLGPRYVVVENVPALLDRGLFRVLGDLASCGFDAEWDCLPASAFGAFGERDRLFVLAYSQSLDGGPHDLLEASREWGPSLQSRRLSGLAVATAGQRENTRLRCEPRLDRLVRRVPGALDRLEGIGNSIFPAVAEWIGRRLMEAARLIPPSPEGERDV